MRLYIIRLVLLVWITNPALGQVGKIRKLQESLPAITDSMRYVDVINKISLLYYEQNIDSTFYYAVRGRDIANRLQYVQGIADATNNLGIVYDIKGNVQLALRYYNDAYNQYRTIGDSSNVAQTLMNIAMVYYASGKTQKALRNFDQALMIGSKIAHDSITALVIYNYMLAYPQKFTGTEKDKNIEKAEKIAQKYADTRLELALEQVKADKLIADNEQSKGILLMELALARALKMELYYLSMDMLIDLGNNHLERDEPKAIAFFQQALAITDEKGYRLYAKDICKKLYDFYFKKGDKDKAFMYSKKLLTIYEKQLEIDRVSGIDYIEYAVKDQQLISEKIKSTYNSRLLWLAIAVCVLTILSIVFLFRNWLLTKKSNEVLTIQFRQLESTTEALEQSNQNYARLIKVVAHDLRNPISGINSLSSLLVSENLTKEESQEFTRLIYESSDNCIKMIGDLLRTDFNFKETDLHKEAFNLSTSLQKAIKLLNFKAHAKNQELILTESVNTEILADPDKLLRAINNLIINAIKFSPEGGTIHVDTKRSADGLVIAVRDNGIGIPKEFAPKIFDPFTSSKRSGTAGEQPFGLGLYITKQIIEAHQGRIWFESEPEKGTTFFVQLPVSALVSDARLSVSGTI